MKTSITRKYYWVYFQTALQYTVSYYEYHLKIAILILLAMLYELRAELFVFITETTFQHVQGV